MAKGSVRAESLRVKLCLSLVRYMTTKKKQLCIEILKITHAWRTWT